MAGEILTGSSVLVAQAQTGTQADEAATEQPGATNGAQESGTQEDGRVTAADEQNAPADSDAPANPVAVEETAQTSQTAQEQGENEGLSVVVEGSEVVSEQVGETYEETHAADAKYEDSVFPPFDSTTFGPQLFWLALTFGILYLLMSRIALPRIGEILEVRRDRIEGDLAEAERLRQKTDQAIQTYESELADARAKSHGIADETRNKIKSEMSEKRREVEADLAKQVAAAEARIEKTKADALANVDQIAAETTVALVGKLSGKVSIKTARSAVSAIVKG